MAGENQSGMECVDFENALSEALDHTLHGSALAKFEAHQRSCPVCKALFQEAQAGLHWLKALEEAEPPRHLVHNILAQTSGVISQTKPVTAAGESWLNRFRRRLVPALSPRFAMSFGMTFFSVTMMLNVAGIKMADLRHMDLSTKGIERTYYSTQARIVRYYENIRLVYEIESRVRDLRRAARPEKEEEQNTPKPPSRSNSDRQPERKYQNYSRDESMPVPAGFSADNPAPTTQARLNRSHA
jgi:hypothetical protein